MTGAMTAAAIVLFANAVFSFLVWPAFLRRVARDPRARDASGRGSRFLVVHVGIVSGALVLAVISAIVGLLLLVDS